MYLLRPVYSKINKTKFNLFCIRLLEHSGIHPDNQFQQNDTKLRLRFAIFAESQLLLIKISTRDIILA